MNKHRNNYRYVYTHGLAYILVCIIPSSVLWEGLETVIPQ